MVCLDHSAERLRSVLRTFHGEFPQSDMASRRGAVKVNPVTGELKRVDGNKEAGTMRSGCVTLPEKYMHAARDAGLASGTGEIHDMCIVYDNRRQVNQQAQMGLKALNGPAVILLVVFWREWSDRVRRASFRGSSDVTSDVKVPFFCCALHFLQPCSRTSSP
jgi:hypothetical protein